MCRRFFPVLFAFAWLVCAAGLHRAAAAERSPLGQSLNDIEVAEHWIYDNLPQALTEAKQTGKPLLVVLRCVPCPPGKTLDEQVMRPAGELADVEKQFVCVRIIKTNGLDLDLFQYDYDMSWNAMFLNADGTIYGRYGTRNSSGLGSDGNLSAAAFAKAAQRALALHKNYPANKAELAAKTGKPVQWKVPEDTPGLTDRRGVEVVRQNCIHCHMVKEYALRAKWEQGKLAETDLFVYPAPQRIGLSLDKNDGLKVDEVEAGSAAAAAGLKAGDELVTAGGQPLISTADLTWALHVASSDKTTVPVTVRRSGALVPANLALEAGWKRADIGWRASSWYGLRQGLKLDPLPSEARTGRNLPADAGALEVKGMFGKGAPKLQAAGLRKGDVIVAVDGAPAPATESEFLVQLRLNHGPQDKVRLTVLRGGGRQELTIPLW